MGTDFETLVTAEYLLKPRLKNVALIVLAEMDGPARFGDIGLAIMGYMAQHVSDSRLYTAMIQLADDGYARKDVTEKNQPLWVITQEGLRHVKKIYALARALDE